MKNVVSATLLSTVIWGGMFLAWPSIQRTVWGDPALRERDQCLIAFMNQHGGRMHAGEALTRAANERCGL